VFELVERGIILSVYLHEFLLQSLKFILVLCSRLNYCLKLLVKFLKIIFPSLNVLLCLHEENLLLLVVMLHLLSQGILSVLKHLNKQF
jgi:hypothetical protein